mgnify:CR=1 FL=1
MPYLNNDYQDPKDFIEMVEKEIKLLPCPFCGAEPVQGPYKRNGWEIKCKGCFVKVQQRVVRLSLDWLKESMAEAWNKRITINT